MSGERARARPTPEGTLADWGTNAEAGDATLDGKESLPDTLGMSDTGRGVVPTMGVSTLGPCRARLDTAAEVRPSVTRSVTVLAPAGKVREIWRAGEVMPPALSSGWSTSSDTP